MFKSIVLGFVLAATLGVALATELFLRFGIQPQFFLLFLSGLFIAMLLVHRGITVLFAVIVLTVSVLQSEQMLITNGFDKDLLMVALLLVVVYPIVHKAMHS